MRIGDDANYLEMVPAPKAGVGGVYSVRVRLSDTLSEITARNDAVVLRRSEAVLRALEEFAELKQHTFELQTGGGGSIRLIRTPHGVIRVKFQIPGWERPSFVYGELGVEGEDSMGFIADVRKLLQPQEIRRVNVGAP